MTDDINFIKVELKSFQDMCKQITDLKAQCKELSEENLFLKSEIQDMKFTRKYLTSEDAGKAFARELLGKPMTESDIAEEQFIENGEAYYERTWNLACEGDDF